MAPRSQIKFQMSRPQRYALATRPSPRQSQPAAPVAPVLEPRLEPRPEPRPKLGLELEGLHVDRAVPWVTRQASSLHRLRPRSPPRREPLAPPPPVSPAGPRSPHPTASGSADPDPRV